MSNENSPDIYVFSAPAGHRQPAPDTPLVRWLMGADVEITPQLMAEIRGEFAAQDRYREALCSEVQSLMRRLLKDAAENAPALDRPVADVMAAMWRGYEIGRYEGVTEAAVGLAAIVKRAAVGVAEG